MYERAYLSMKELASFVGLSFGTLRNWKSYQPHRLPPHVTLLTGKREIWRFSISEVEKWLNNGRQGETL